jgi:hypothetical protein
MLALLPKSVQNKIFKTFRIEDFFHLPKSVQNKIFKTFRIEDFSHLPQVSRTPAVVQLELRISLRNFEKILNSPNGILRGLGETDL